MVEKQEEVALGGISIRIHSAYVHDFDDYYFSLNPFTNQRNPWFAEFWETRFQCNLELGGGGGGGVGGGTGGLIGNKTTSENRVNFVRPAGAKVYNRTCTGRESLRNNHKQDAKMAFVQKSIITMALGLDSMQRAICGPHRPGLCPEMLPVNGSTLLQHLMNVSFSFLNEEVWFDEQGDPPGKYEILNFQRRRSTSNLAHTQTVVSQKEDSEPFDSSENNAANRTDYSVFTASKSSKEAPWAAAAAAAKTKKLPTDSYSTLKVYRDPRQYLLASTTTSNSAEQHYSDRMAPKSLVTKRQLLAPKLVGEPAGSSLPASGYSATNGYEYVHVGSWRSSDGLSLFGEISWPRSGARGDYLANVEPVPSNESLASSGFRENEMPKSVCSLPCARGHAKVSFQKQDRSGGDFRFHFLSPFVFFALSTLKIN